MTENSWRKALTQFKRALEVHPSPEAHFALASLYYKLDRDQLAGRHLRKAIEMDENYREAMYLLAIIYKRTGQTQLAENVLNRAKAGNPTSAKSRKRAGVNSRKGEKVFAEGKLPSNGLITGADRRLSTALREDALRAFMRIDVDRR